MPTLIQYTKASDAWTEYTLRGPDDLDAPQPQELCTIDGITYVSVPDGEELPEQFPQIADSIAPVTLTPELRKAIIDASPQCRLIAQRMIEQIRAHYTPDDEAFLTRISVGSLAGMYTYQPGEAEEVLAFGAFVEGVRQWGRDRRAELGL